MGKHGRVTSRHLAEIRQRNAAGENDRAIAKTLGVPARAVNYYRRAMGLSRAGRNKKTYTYTVYDAKTDQILAFGSVEECVAALGFANNNGFYAMVSRAMKGKQKKYAVVREAIQ